MSKELTVTSIPVITDEQWSLVKRTLMDTETVQFSDDEFKLFVNQAKRTGLDPFTRQIYATKTGGKMTVQATIDGLRLIAQRSGEYQGQTRPVWFDDEGKEYRVWPKKKGYPYACEVGVYKSGFKEPLYAMAIFDEYVAKHKDFKTKEIKIGYMWQKMPALMIAKVAEALALRKAFPNDMSGIYSTEEISNDEDIKQLRSVNEEQPAPKIDVMEEAKKAIKKAQDKAKEPPKENKNPLTNESNPQDPQINPQPQEPERFPKKEDITISREQADFLMQTGYKFGHTKEEILSTVYNLTKKIRLGEVNNKEFDLILQFLADHRKENK